MLSRAYNDWFATERSNRLSSTRDPVIGNECGAFDYVTSATLCGPRDRVSFMAQTLVS